MRGNGRPQPHHGRLALLRGAIVGDGVHGHRRLCRFAHGVDGADVVDVLVGQDDELGRETVAL